MIFNFSIQPTLAAGRSCAWFARQSRRLAAALLLCVLPASIEAQAAGVAAQPPQSAAVPAQDRQQDSATKAKPPSSRDRRKAVKLYLGASKLYEGGKFEEALGGYQQAAKLDPTNADYRLAADVASSHAVEALVQSAARSRLTGDTAGSRESLERALKLDPKNPVITQHLYELGDDALRGEPQPLYRQAASGIGGGDVLLPTASLRSFHLRLNTKQVIEQVFKAYGVDALLDSSVTNNPMRLDLDDADFATAAHVLGLVTGTFYVPVDAHRVLVARDNKENRQQFMRDSLETVRLPGLSDTELTDVGNLAKNVFNIRQASADATAGTLTLRAAPSAIGAFNASMSGLLAGRDQVVVDVSIIQLAHSSEHNTGIAPPQSFSAFNVYTMEQSILSQNQSLVQQIISSGLASADNPLAILAILLASGQVSSSLFNNGIALFGGGITSSALQPSGPATLTLSLNSSDSRQIDNIQLRMGDGEASTIREGTKYPIQTSSFSSIGSNLPNIPGLNAAGSSSGLSSLLAQYGGSTQNIPMIEYQDLGLTLKVTPKVMLGSEVALTIDLKIDSLSGASIGGNPILNHQQFSAVAQLREGEAAELASYLTRQQSRAVSGTPGLGQIPGMNDVVSDKDAQIQASTLLIVMTPHLVRSTHEASRSRMLMLDKKAATAQ